jgi:glycosyltransferase involved in cell wall biosynthesis
VNTESQPFVSVITPVYNMGLFLPECIESVLRQTFKNFEYIIVNNCSTDNTLEVAMEYEGKDNRIKVHNNDSFVGVIENHNRAFRLISQKSKYCKVVSADDWIFPNCLEQLVGLAEAYPSVGFVSSYSIAGNQISFSGLEYERKIVSGREICRETLMGGPYVFGAPTSNMYRADLIRRSKEFYVGNNPHADTTPFYLWLKDYDFGFVHQILSYTRIHHGSQTSATRKSGLLKVAQIGDLLQFGPQYLSKEEQKNRLKYLVNDYYYYLASFIIDNMRNREFLKDQKVWFQELGLRFSTAKFIKAVFLKGMKLLMKPRRVINRIYSIKNALFGQNKKIELNKG